jgi:hypothetical protein
MEEVGNHGQVERLEEENLALKEELRDLSKVLKDRLCFQIGEWYLEWKNCLCFSNGTHRLGFAKEKLKERICSKIEEVCNNG